MAKLQWGDPLDRLYEVGVNRGVLNVHGSNECVPWNGLVSVEDRTESNDPEDTYYDAIKFNSRIRPSDFEGSISALYSPPEFDVCDGSFDHGHGLFSSHNAPQKFNFSYRSMVGPLDYKLHFIYNALASPANRSYETISDDAEVEPIEWDFTTSPVFDEGARHRSHFYLDTTKSNLMAIWAIEQVLYGNEQNDPQFPTYSEIQTVTSDLSTIEITDHGDGTWSIDANDDIAYMLDTIEQLFGVDWTGLNIVGNGVFRIRD